MKNISHENKPAIDYFREELPKTFENFNVEFENDLVGMKFVHFTEYTSRDGKYQFFKLFFEDKDNKRTYCIKANKSMLFKLIYETLNCEEFKNVF